MDEPKINISFEIALLILLAGLWGSSYLLLKVALQTIPPITVVAIRVSVAAVFLTVILVLRGESLPTKAQTWRMLLVQAFLNSIGAWTILAWGQQFVDSGLASVLNSTSPIFVFLITLLLTRHEPTGALRLIGACLGLVGVALIIGTDALKGLGQQVLAQLAILLSAVMYACAAIYGKRFADVSPPATAAGVMIWASACLVPASILIESPWMLQPSALSIAAVITLGIFCTGFAMLLYFRLLQTLGSLGVASQAYLRSCVGVGLGVWLLGETISPIVGMGLFAAVLGVAAINFSVRSS